VRRNRDRFPKDFAFQISASEWKNLRYQIGTLKTDDSRHGILRSQTVTLETGRGQHRKYRPWVFTEHGAIMAATVLNSERAIQMSIFVVRAFVRMREALAANRQIAAKLSELESRLENHDADIQELVEAIRSLMSPPARNPKRIGFENPAGAANCKSSLHLEKNRRLQNVRRTER